MTETPQDLYRRYVWAGAMSRDADALAELFAADGVFEAPLVPAGHAFPRRLAGREEIRAGMAAYYARSANTRRAVDMAKSRYAFHTTADPDVFIVEIDAALAGAEEPPTMSLVQIFRLRDGKFALVRDYFNPELAD